MERYSRVSSSKWQSIYSEEFKRFVRNEYLTGSMTKSEVESKHKLGNGRLSYPEIGLHKSVNLFQDKTNLTPNQVHQNNIKTEKLWKNYYIKNPIIVNQ